MGMRRLVPRAHSATRVACPHPLAPAPAARCVCVGSFVFKLCVHSCISPSLFSQGYYCPPNSTSSTQVECGSVSVYCPAGSPSPIIVPDGLFSSGGQGPSTQTSAVPCPSGAYCLGGVQVPCPAGRYGCSVQISDPLCNGTTAFGHLFVLFYSPLLSSHFLSRVQQVSAMGVSIASLDLPARRSSPVVMAWLNPLLCTVLKAPLCPSPSTHHTTLPAGPRLIGSAHRLFVR